MKSELLLCRAVMCFADERCCVEMKMNQKRRQAQRRDEKERKACLEKNEEIIRELRT